MDARELFLLLSLSLTVTSLQGDLSFNGKGFQVFHTNSAEEHVEKYEVEMWFRTKKHSEMVLLMIQNGVSPQTLVELHDGKLR